MTRETFANKAAETQQLALLWPYLKVRWKAFAAALVLIPLTTLASLSQPYLMKRAVDALVVHKSREILVQVVVVFAMLTVLEALLRLVQTYLVQLGSQHALMKLRNDTFARIQKLKLAYLDRHASGKLVTRVTDDVDALSELFSAGVVTALADIVLLIGIVVVMVSIDFKLSLFAFATLPPLALLVEHLRRKMRKAYGLVRDKVAELNSYLAEQVSGISVVQSYGKQTRCAEEYRVINQGYRDTNFQAIRYDASLYSIVEATAAVCLAALLWYASVQAGLLEEQDQRAAYVGTIVAFYEYIQRFFVPIRDLSSKYAIIQRGVVASERIFGVLNAPHPDAPAAIETPEDKHTSLQGLAESPVGLRFDKVCLKYPNRNSADVDDRTQAPEVLRGLSFTVEKGEKVAIVGTTGAGKSSIVSCLLRFYEIESGRIEMDGEDIRSYDVDVLRQHFAWVPQDLILFEGDLLSNIALGSPRPDEELAMRCLERIGAHQRFASRLGGLHARVVPHGSNFSAGEKQLVAFARCLYRDKPYLLLDEATANVDSESEHILQHAVKEVLKDRTAIIIAHRMSTVRDTDRILVMHRGVIVESGTHDQLMELNGRYAQLYQLQFES